MNYNPSPKSEFIKDPLACKRHREMIESHELRRSIDVALLTMSREMWLNAPADMGSCAAAHLRMAGAQDFVERFLNLAETPAATTRTDTTNLPSNVPTGTKRN